jgi:teichoic acid transport system permease protein
MIILSKNDIKQLGYMVVEDFKRQYLGTALGGFWGVINPIVLTALYCLVFELGLKAKTDTGVNFSFWLMAGIIPYFYFSEALGKGTGSFVEYGYLIKKMVFRFSFIPLFKIFSSFLIHFFFILLVAGLSLFLGQKFSISFFGLCYFSFCLVALVIPICYLTASIQVFLRDASQIVGIILQLFFWGTPIFWNSNIIPEKYMIISHVNPLSYIVEGYRNSFIWGERLSIDPGRTMFFWCEVVCLAFISLYFYRRLSRHFTDAL